RLSRSPARDLWGKGSLHLSMGCNHCLDPSCMTGCPTRAYTKDPRTGIVLHDADACIGCEYCIWNCPYSVPSFNDERGVVGKCDMCHGRLTQGDAPACVSACPSEALAIEIVDVAEWRHKYRDEANAPGLPSAEDTISTTRITLPNVMPTPPEKTDHHRVRPAKPHYSLVLMTVLTQLSIAGFASAWLLNLFGGTAAAPAAVVTLALGLAAVAASPLHLGRPALAPLAIRNLRSSWLSREILGLSAFGVAASAYAAMLVAGLPAAKTAGAVASALGLFAMYATSRIYLVHGRPSWNSAHTVAEFFLTGAMLGPLLLAALGAMPADVLHGSTACAAIGNILVEIWRFLHFVRSEDHERQATARLLSGPLARLFLLRLGLVAAGAIVLPARGLPLAGFAMATAGALLGRYLFFVSVVPKNMALPFLERRAAA
ncbi:MAG: dimethyl sulfoxide reductase anchor subunit, partial [Bryobacterales bacterium]|nr:dimethyl sulfoxide reductase anchor subunit [Bryobacterales bacterium]